MINKHSALREFGKFRLDIDKKLLWLGAEPIALPLKAVDLLCVLVKRQGQVVSKDEIWQEVWKDAFVEETNLTHNIYLLRKAFKDYGESDLIKTVPRRGYRFASEVHEVPNAEIILDRHGLTQTTIEIHEDADAGQRTAGRRKLFERSISRTTTATLIVIAFSLLLGGGVLVWDRGSAQVTNPSIKSLAVLPLHSFLQNRNDEDLRMRITDSLITRLGSMKNVAVRPTNAVARFVGDDIDAVQIGSKLNVDAVLQGQVQQEGDRIRVTLQLIAVNGGKQLWSGQFDGQDDHILDLQDNISSTVASSLDRSEQKQLLASPPTCDTRSIRSLLKGPVFLG